MWLDVFIHDLDHVVMTYYTYILIRVTYHATAYQVKLPL